MPAYACPARPSQAPVWLMMAGRFVTTHSHQRKVVLVSITTGHKTGSSVLSSALLVDCRAHGSFLAENEYGWPERGIALVRKFKFDAPVFLLRNSATGCKAMLVT